MSTIFRAEAFRFTDDEQAPKHVEGWPTLDVIDPSLYHVEGFVPEDGDFVWVAANLSDAETANRMLMAAVRRLRSQGATSYGVAVVGPGFEGAYSAASNIIEPAETT